jgi:hypothetical protein
VDVSELDADGLKDYGKLCGWTLAQAHTALAEAELEPTPSA